MSIRCLRTGSNVFKFIMHLSSAPKRPCSDIAKGRKFAIEGNIATGKSTFIKMLERECDEWHVVPEPVARWMNVSKNNDEAPLTTSQQSGGNLLKMFYDDIHRWSYTFQSYAFFSRMRLQRKGLPEKLYGSKNPVQFFERSLQSDRYVFAMNCYESGLMSETEWNLYQDWTSYLMHSLGELKLDGIIYLRARPEVCFHRMQKRGRNEEKDVSLNYLRNLHEKHEALLHDNSIEVHDAFTDVPILTLECNEDFIDNVKLREAMMGQVREFLQHHGGLNDSGLELNNVSSLTDGGGSDIEF